MARRRANELLLMWSIDLAVMVLSCWAEPPCRLTLQANVMMKGERLVLSDLMAPETCPSLLRAARQVPVGKNPLPGSTRVLKADEVRSLLTKIGYGTGEAGFVLAEIPPRIAIRRAGTNLSCAKIVAKILHAPHPDETDRSQWCGADDRIPSDAEFMVAGKHWNPMSHSWQWIVRCIHAEDCVPFFADVPDRASAVRLGDSARGAGFSPADLHGEPLVRARQTVVVSWEHAAIRAEVPAISLESGRQGDIVRVRLLSNGRLLRAAVTGANALQVQP